MKKVFGVDVPLSRLKNEIKVFHERFFFKLDKIKVVSSLLAKVVDDWKDQGLVELKDNQGKKEVYFKSLERKLEGNVYKDDFWERLLRYGATDLPQINLKEELDYFERRLNLL